MEGQGPSQWVLGFFPRGESGRGAKLTIHVHLVTRLRMSGAILLRPLYAFTEWTGVILPFTFNWVEASAQIYALSSGIVHQAPDRQMAGWALESVWQQYRIKKPNMISCFRSAAYSLH
jgi:hypothetical protein